MIEMIEGKKVLVADDHKGFRDTLADLLQMWGFNVCAVDSVKECLSAVERFLPQVIITDFNFGSGEANGLDLIDAIRAHAKPEIRSVGIIMMSGTDDEEIDNLARGAGANAYFSKPFQNYDTLKKAIAGL